MDTGEAGTTVSFDGVLSVRGIEAARQRLLDALSRQPAVAVDCSAAEAVDLSFIQLLLAARLSAERAGKRLALVGPAPALQAALLQAGFPAAGTEAADPWWAEAA
jgi:anti-anti-sigma regulatory factor